MPSSSFDASPAKAPPTSTSAALWGDIVDKAAYDVALFLIQQTSSSLDSLPGPVLVAMLRLLSQTILVEQVLTERVACGRCGMPGCSQTGIFSEPLRLEEQQDEEDEQDGVHYEGNSTTHRSHKKKTWGRQEDGKDDASRFQSRLQSSVIAGSFCGEGCTAAFRRLLSRLPVGPGLDAGIAIVLQSIRTLYPKLDDNLLTAAAANHETELNVRGDQQKKDPQTSSKSALGRKKEPTSSSSSVNAAGLAMKLVVDEQSNNQQINDEGNKSSAPTDSDAQMLYGLPDAMNSAAVFGEHCATGTTATSHIASSRKKQESQRSTQQQSLLAAAGVQHTASSVVYKTLLMLITEETKRVVWRSLRCHHPHATSDSSLSLPPLLQTLRLPSTWWATGSSSPSSANDFDDGRSGETAPSNANCHASSKSKTAAAGHGEEEEEAELPPLDLSTTAVQRRTVFGSTVLAQTSRFSLLCYFDIFVLEGTVQSWFLSELLPTFDFHISDGSLWGLPQDKAEQGAALWALLVMVAVAAVAKPSTVGAEWSQAVESIQELIAAVGETEEALRDCVQLFFR